MCDVNGDGRPDILVGAGTGMLLLASKNAAGQPVFVESQGSLAFPSTPEKVGPVFGDFDNDGFPDLFVPQKNGCKLFKNDGKGRFTDVTAKAGDLAGNFGWATSAAWGDFDNDGKLDLLVGCLKGPTASSAIAATAPSRTSPKKSAWDRRSSTRRRWPWSI